MEKFWKRSAIALVLLTALLLGVAPRTTYIPGPPIDDMSGAQIGVSFAHHECHDGDCFVADFADATMADTETIVLALKTMPDPKQMHLVMEFTTLVGGNLELCEGVTWTAETGTEVEIINRRRRASMDSSGLLANVAQAGFVAADVLVANPTGLNTGSATCMHHIFAWGTQARGSTGGNRDIEEFINMADTAYSLMFTATGNSNAGQVIMNWYEHSDPGS